MTHRYQVRPRTDNSGVDLVSDALPFGRLWYAEPNAAKNAISYAQFYSRAHQATIDVIDRSGAIVATYEHAGNFSEF